MEQNVEQVLNYVNQSDIQKIINNGISLLKDFFQEESGNKLTKYQQQGFLTMYSQLLQKELNQSETKTI